MRQYKGYMTLEAALIVPMVICVFSLLIYFSYYLYGRCMLSQDTYILAFRAGIEGTREHGEDPVSYVAQKASAKAGNKYFGSSFPRFEASVQGKEILVKGEAQTRHSAMGRYFLKPQSGWEYEAAGKAKMRKYAKHIRTTTRLRDIGKEILSLGED